ncbi:neuron navigator 2 isoform X2 [Octodon degus]|uniref:Neuron navigator 2 isoform X2 n=1 Tax=Octodon degus TaxID=10160 RepID=A0A6P6DES8_OCTDE|nr:neuron navigator 2 isoform X2 [Octodon degus]
MPAILVASKMKSGLPKPVHSAAPILHVPPARAGSQPCYLKLGSKVEVSKTTYPSQIPLKSQGLQEQAGEVLPLRKSGSVENGFDTQIYTDWANHYLAKSGHKRLIKDLQQDVTDGVLLAQIIQVVANEKIEDINGCPKNRSQMIENIDACLNFLAAKGINIQGLSAEEIRNGNLKAILGLFFSLSRYKQQQQQPQKQHLASSGPPAGCPAAGAPSQCQAGTTQQQVSATPQALCQPHQPAPHQPSKSQAEMQSSASPKDSSQSKIIRFTLGQKKISRLPGPTARVSAAGSEAKTRGGSATANNRRSQSFNNYDKSKPVTSPPPPQAPNSHEKEPLTSSASPHPGMSEHVPGPLDLAGAPAPANGSASSAIPQPAAAASKPWRSKSLSVKHSATAAMLSVKPAGPEPPRPTPEAVKPAPNNQKSMLEKLKLFNSKGGSKAGEGPGSRDASCERLEILPSFEENEELEPAGRTPATSGPASSSPKIALKGIAQRTFSRALTNKKSSPKGNEKEKEKLQREKEKGKDLAKRASGTERPDLKEEPKEEASGLAVTEMPKKSSKIGSFIPKGGKLSSAKKEPTAPPHSGIPKPGMKSTPGKSPSAPVPPKDGERGRSAKLSSGVPPQKAQLDGRHSSSSSSLASSEGKAPSGTTLNHSISSQTVSGSVGSPQTTGTNTASVQLPQPQQQYSHPNTATVAPFLYRSQTDTEGNVTAESSPAGVSVEPGHYTKSGQPALEERVGEDPEARRLRTVKNIADLRQNLEETMSSLRGTQVTHSTLETTFDTNVTTEISGRSILSLTGRPTPLSWRLGQSSPRLQAGDAPSMGNGYPPRANASRFISAESGRYVYPAPLRRQLASRGSSVCHVDVSDKAGEEADLEGISMDAPGYMSDGDVLSKNIRADDITSGYMTDGGLGLYTRRLNRLPDGMAVVRETLQRNTSLGLGDADSWDDSSSVSSGISDTIDNLSTDDINTSSSISSYANTPASSRKNLDVQTDAEKHSQVERNSLWSGDDVKKSDGGSDSGVRMEPGAKWRRNPSDVSDESDKSTSGKKTTVISQTGSWRRGMTAQVGITVPRTKPSAPASALKTPGTGKTDDAKVSEKGRLSPKASQVKRSPSDAGRSSGDESKKPLPTSSRTTPTANANSFGFKKQSGSVAGLAMITASGATVTSRSATLGKIPKSSALVGRSGSRKTSMDGTQNQDDGYLSLSSRTNLQYRSLPRPSKSNSRNGAGNRSSTSSIDSNISSKSAGLPMPKLREPSKTALGSSLPGLVNQTDKEKGISSDNESVASCNSVKVNPAAQPVLSSAQATLQPGAKYPDVASPTLRRLFGGKPTKQAPITTPENMKTSVVISNPHATMTQQGNLDSPSGSGVLSSGSSSPLYSKNADLNPSPLASSPSSAHSGPSNSLTWGTTASSSSAVSKDGLGFQSVSSLHTSCESIDISLGSGGGLSHNSSTGLLVSSKDDSLTPFVRTNSVKTTLSESPLSSPAASPKFCRSTLPRKQDSDPHLDRNTLPKKGLRYTPTSQLRTQEDAKEWLRSHSAGGLQDTAANSPFSSGSSVTSPSGTRFNFSQLASPTTVTQMSLSNPTMLRTHSLSNADGQYDPYTDSRFRNSSMSLDEKSRTMSRSGSFRDGFEEVHGSSLSLVSSTSSIYSTPEEKCQSEIRKLRRELDASQEKVSALTTQLTANAHLVAAFEQSLGNMTIRLQSLTMTAEQKDSELNELRKTIELLKKQNAAAQAAINGVINTPELNCKGNGSSQATDLRIRRQHSSDSVSSINSATSHSSVGSNIESDSKKKKRKNWLRSSFKQAFGKKKSPKSASSHSDIEEMTDSSLPSSPKLPHNGSTGSTGSTPLLRNSYSNSLISECMDSEAETVMQLRNELRDKEMKLTDIRLEALSSAHQLDQLREAMNRMQSEIEKLKAENDRLKSESQGSGCSRAPSQVSISASPRQSLGLSQPSLNLTESTSLDMLLDGTGECAARKEGGRHVKIVVSFQEEMKWKEEYIIHVDPASQLGLNSDSVLGYSIGEIRRSNGSETPELLPCGYLVGENTTISVSLKGLAENSLDSLVFESLIPKPILQRYVSLLVEHRRIILSGPSGTGKTYLANRLSEYVVLREGRELTDGTIATFNVDHKSSKELRQYLSNLADQCNSENNAVDMPLVIILDNLHHVSSLGEIFNGLLNCKYHKCPYIIGTMNQATSSTPNLQLHHNFRWVLCANHTEPVKGFLGRFLRRKLMETEISGRVRNMELVKIIDWIPKVWHHLNRFLEAHSSSDVTIGPRLFLSCPIDVDGSRVWFTDLWNYSIIPYLLEAVREGLQLYGRRAPWEDPAKWVMDTYPWVASPQQHEWPPLLQLRPEDVGFDGYALPREGSASKQVPPSDAEGDPLMNMLMRLQEAANYSSPQSYDSDSNSNSHHDDILDSSLESTL